MNFKVHTDVLLHAVQAVSRAAAVKTSIPALTGIYLEALDMDTLLLKATDLEIGISYTIPAQIGVSGTMVIPAKYFLDMLKKFPQTELSFVQEDPEQSLTIHYHDSHVSLHTFPPEQFSFLPDIESEEILHMDSELLSSMIRKISISFSHDVTRPVLNGALVEIDEYIVRMVSSDTYRLSLMEGTLAKKCESSIKPIIVPAKALMEFSRMAEKEEFVQLKIDQTQMQMEMGRMTLSVRLIDGTFPSYQNVIPTEYGTKIIVNTKELLLSLERATVISSDQSISKTCTVRLDIQEAFMRITSHSPNIGEIDDKVTLQEKEGEDLAISFNGSYLIDILKVIETENTIIELHGNLSPGIIKPYDGKFHFLSLILPVRS